MKLKFLGTAAAEGCPALFCNCELCTKAREQKGKDIRTRFSIMIDDCYKIDFPPDSFHHMISYNLDYTKLKHVFITHPHEDHLLPTEFVYLSKWFSNLQDYHLNIYGCKETITMISSVTSKDSNAPIFHELKAFDIVETDDFIVHTLPANHMHENDHPFNYLFERKVDHKCFLCAHDTGYFFEPVWDYLKKFHISLVSLDCTHGKKSQMNNHLGHQEYIIVKNRLIEDHIADEKTIFVANHFSHNGQWSQQDLEDFFTPHHVIIAYDGMELEF